MRDLGDLYERHGREEGGRRIVDLRAAGYDKLLGGGSPGGAYAVIVDRFTPSAAKKVSDAGGEIVGQDDAGAQEIKVEGDG